MTRSRTPGPIPDTPTPAARIAEEGKEAFAAMFGDLFRSHNERIYRMLVRLSADPALAADLAQETFVRLYRRGEAPHRPEAWLITVALNLFRNARTTRSRRDALLTASRVERSLADPPVAPDARVERAETKTRVRAALDHLPERERMLLLLHAEGYPYRDIAEALGMKETSVGTSLARARTAFRRSYQEDLDAPR
ncbi:MAG: sigma-70 family RNA polymerase sigma factor [Gemmatimonadota bacterium]|nr:sigma-70 family RNA polymerase sigma factor [Gemmatimonadota bacterium]